MFRLPFALLALLVMSLPLAAQSYRLVVGDRVIVNYDFLEEPKTTSVDLDGNIRLSELGSIEAQGRTLDEVEEAITEGMIQGGFSGVSFVSVEVDTYAAVVVSGFVERSGSYDYLPGMTVGAAIAVAGGLGSGDAQGPNADVQAVNARRRAGTAAEIVAAALSDIARLEAALSEDDAEVALDPARVAGVPRDLQDGMEARLEAERIQLANERLRAETLLASWTQEIEDFEAQIQLLDGRIDLKIETVARLEAEVADLENLRSQGLTTTARFSSLQQRLSDDREELLTLETAKITARRAAGIAARNRAEFLTDRRQANLEALELARAEFVNGQRDYRLALSELTVLENDTEALAADQGVIELRYSIQSLREGRGDLTNVERATPVLPGDIVLVDILDGFEPTR